MHMHMHMCMHMCMHMHMHMSCHGGGLESSPLSRLPMLHRSSVHGLVGREGTGEGHCAGKCASRPTQHD